MSQPARDQSALTPEHAESELADARAAPKTMEQRLDTTEQLSCRLTGLKVTELEGKVNQLEGKVNQLAAAEMLDALRADNKKLADDNKKLTDDLKSMGDELEDLRNRPQGMLGELRAAQKELAVPATAREALDAASPDTFSLTLNLHIAKERLEWEADVRQELEATIRETERTLEENERYRTNWLEHLQACPNPRPDRGDVKSLGADARKLCRLLGIDLSAIPDDDWGRLAGIIESQRAEPLPLCEKWLLVPRAADTIQGSIEVLCLATLAANSSNANRAHLHSALAQLGSRVMRSGVTTLANLELVREVVRRLLAPNDLDGESLFLVAVLASAIATAAHDETITSIVRNRTEDSQYARRPFDYLARHVVERGLGVDEMRDYCARVGVVWESADMGFLWGREVHVAVEFGLRQIHILEESRLRIRIPKVINPFGTYDICLGDRRTIPVSCDMTQGRVFLAAYSRNTIEYGSNGVRPIGWWCEDQDSGMVTGSKDVMEE